MSAIYINTETLAYPQYQGHIRDANPDITDNIQGDDFPNPPPAPFAAVENTPVPTHDDSTHTVVEGAPECVDGVWKRTWQLVALTPEQIAFRDEMAAEIAAKQAEIAEQMQLMEAAAASGAGAPAFIEIP